MKKAFLVDFDGTITTKDVGLSIVKHFAEKGWEEIGQLWIDKKIGTAKCGQNQWDLIKANENDIREYVRKFEINPGFKEFVNMINEKSYKIIIASDGYDIYINEILKINGYKDMEISCNSAIYDNGWKLSFLNKDTACDLCGNCKKKEVQILKSQGYEVTYIGDGYSDRCACIYADNIFAKSTLREYCEQQNIPHYTFNTFFDVLNYFK